MARRHDPERRDRIIDAAISCIAEDGVAGTSHRRVAARADVPLGSMTYHFASMDDLLVEAFTRFATSIADTFEQRLAASPDQDAAAEAVVALIHGDLQRSQREHVLTYELYTLAARRPAFRSITQTWMRASRRALERHFAPETVRALDAYIEGAALHIALDPDPQPPAATRAAVDRLTRAPARGAVASVRP
ncbi:TetR/AcrR family transcriptional regulator [Marinitenerispora sediminis]|nr:TetR family transcriptional regulator [Marinitenerispora sediminis]